MQIDLDIHPDLLEASKEAAVAFGSDWRGATMVDIVWFVQATGTLPNRYLVRDAEGNWFDADEEGFSRLIIACE